MWEIWAQNQDIAFFGYSIRSKNILKYFNRKWKHSLLDWIFFFVCLLQLSSRAESNETGYFSYVNAFHYVDLVSDWSMGETFGEVEITGIGWCLTVISCYIKSKHSHLNFLKCMKHGSSVFIQYLFLFKTSLIWATVPMHVYSHTIFSLCCSFPSFGALCSLSA